MEGIASSATAVLYPGRIELGLGRAPGGRPADRPAGSSLFQTKKSPALRGFFASGVLVDLNLISLHPFLAFGRHERDGLAFAQAFEACAFD